MKKTLLTGLVISLPIALTLWILFFFIHVLTDPFVDLVSSFTQELFSGGLGFLSEKELNRLAAQLLILLFLIVFTLGLGALARWVIVHYFIRAGEFFLARIPFISSIYLTLKDVIRTIFKAETKSFKQVVLLPFPSREIYSIGLVTKELVKGCPGGERVAVFLPTTPNPTSGYLLLVEERDLIHLDLTIEEALKYIISCGVVSIPVREIKGGPA